MSKIESEALFAWYLIQVVSCMQYDAFLPRDASAERGNAIVSRPSVCLSVCDIRYQQHI